jgi:hypothetical protein
VVEHAAQLVGGEEPDAAGGEQSLQATPAGGPGAEDAHDGEASSRLEDAPGLAEGAGRVPELVQGAAADGPREARVGERQVLGVGPGEGGRYPRPSGAAGRLPQHGGGDVYAHHVSPVAERAGEAARVEARGAPQVEVQAAAFRADQFRDDPELAFHREGLAREQGQGVDAPEGLVGPSGAGEEVAEVGDVVRDDAVLEQVEVSALHLVGLARGGGAYLAGQDHAVGVDPPGVDEARGIRRPGPDEGEEVLVEHPSPSGACGL